VSLIVAHGSSHSVIELGGIELGAILNRGDHSDSLMRRRAYPSARMTFLSENPVQVHRSLLGTWKLSSRTAQQAYALGAACQDHGCPQVQIGASLMA
jgi:hypothetical protein